VTKAFDLDPQRYPQDYRVRAWGTDAARRGADPRTLYWAGLRGLFLNPERRSYYRSDPCHSGSRSDKPAIPSPLVADNIVNYSYLYASAQSPLLRRLLPPPDRDVALAPDAATPAPRVSLQALDRRVGREAQAQ
jgi:hypothetical protein